MISPLRSLLLLILMQGAIVAAHAASPTLPAGSELIAGYESADSVARRIASLGPRTIEGIWSFPDREALIAIERTSPAASSYRIVIIRTPDRAIRPGTVMGILSPSGSSDKFDASLYTTSSRGTLSSPKRFTLSLTETDSRLIFARVGSRYSVDLTRLLPYMFRRLIRINRSGIRTAPAGCVRIFPAPAAPDSPVYL